MTQLFLVLNFLFAVMGLYWARQDFEKGNNGMGWMWIFVSAWNTATLLNQVF